MAEVHRAPKRFGSANPGVWPFGIHLGDDFHLGGAISFLRLVRAAILGRRRVTAHD